MSDDEGTPVVRVGLKRLDPAAMVLEDPVLSRAALVRALGEGARALLSAAAVRRLASGAKLFDRGDAAGSVYFLAHGEIAVLSGEAASVVPATQLAPGDVCGAGAALEGAPRAATVVAASVVDVIEIPVAVLRPLVESSAELRAVLEEARRRSEGAAGDLEAFLDRW